MRGESKKTGRRIAAVNPQTAEEKIKELERLVKTEHGNIYVLLCMMISVLAPSVRIKFVQRLFKGGAA